MQKDRLVEIRKGETGTGLLIEHDGYISADCGENRKLFEEINAHVDGEFHCPKPFIVSAVFQKFGIENANGRIFPVLFTELIHGFLELFISHGLPKDRDLALAVIGKSDFLKAEPWDMRIGPELWKMFSASFNDINSKELPYLLKRVSALEIHKFNYLMKEVFAKTNKGRQIMSYLSAKAKNDMDYMRFVDRMDTKKDGLGVITDDYIHEEEF